MYMHKCFFAGRIILFPKLPGNQTFYKIEYIWNLAEKVHSSQSSKGGTDSIFKYFTR